MNEFIKESFSLFYNNPLYILYFVGGIALIVIFGILWMYMKESEWQHSIAMGAVKFFFMTAFFVFFLLLQQGTITIF